MAGTNLFSSESYFYKIEMTKIYSCCVTFTFIAGIVPSHVHILSVTQLKS